MGFTPKNRGEALALRAATKLRKKYSAWTVDRKPREVAIPYLTWNDEGARDAYRMICLLNRIPVEA